MKSTRSFDAFLLAILLVIGLAQLRHGWFFGSLLYFLPALVGLLIIRRVIGAKTIPEAISWMRAHVRIAAYLLFILLTSLVYIGYSYWGGYVDLIEAIGVYFVVISIFSAIVLLGHSFVQFLLNLFMRN